ncbi:MAG: peptidoglycan DD-metalloendopeptidase family protein [Bacteroidales bacterium]|nr:peptidoglycan DD-metalloendopeptidase family protein [Bacteroidales bacterium]MBR6160235.1 peptidoglycan DD-metalloendopeptidase family protein [Bacteroidales bacterium]
MRTFLTLLCCCLSSLLLAQGLDVTEFSQMQALQDTTANPPEQGQFQIAPYPEISEVYQIPAYDLYDRYWDVAHLRSRSLEIPFSNDRIMLILVQAANNPFAFPCSYDEVSQRYGQNGKQGFHPGVDLKVVHQTLVRNCFDGVVRMARYYGDYGWMVVVRHYNGLETLYAHLDKLCVKPGQMLHAGDVIGQAGNSGNTKDYILHFETRFMNEFFDPNLLIDFENETLNKNTLVLTPEDFRPATEVEKTSATQAPSPVTEKPIQTPTPKSQPTTNSESHSKPIANGQQPTANSETQSTANSESLSKPTANGQQPTAKTESSVAEYYTVQKGDNLYRISVKFHTTVDNLLKINNLPNADRITEGQRLRVK